MDKRVLVSLFENGDVWECECGGNVMMTDHAKLNEREQWYGVMCEKCGRRMMWKVRGEE